MFIAYAITVIAIVVGVIFLAIHGHPFIAFFLLLCFPTFNKTSDKKGKVNNVKD